jgi:hypothetical protein
MKLHSSEYFALACLLVAFSIPTSFYENIFSGIFFACLGIYGFGIFLFNLSKQDERLEKVFNSLKKTAGYERKLFHAQTAIYYTDGLIKITHGRKLCIAACGPDGGIARVGIILSNYVNDPDTFYIETIGPENPQSILLLANITSTKVDHATYRVDINEIENKHTELCKALIKIGELEYLCGRSLQDWIVTRKDLKDIQNAFNK